MHLQRNATQRNAYHHYILNNNFKFYIYQFFRTLEFLSVFVRFAKIISFIKENQNLCSFFVEKKNHATGGQSPKTISFFVKKRTTPQAGSRQKLLLFVKKKQGLQPAFSEEQLRLEFAIR